MTFIDIDYVHRLPQGSYTDYIAVDEEVQQLVEHIQRLVKDNAEECAVCRSYIFVFIEPTSYINQIFL